jgi:hypothetical protein
VSTVIKEPSVSGTALSTMMTPQPHRQHDRIIQSRRFRRRRSILGSSTQQSLKWMGILWLSCAGWIPFRKLLTVGRDAYMVTLLLLPHACAASMATASPVDEREETAVQSSTTFLKRQSSNSSNSSKRTSLNQILIRAGRRGLGGGLPGALAGMVQVVSLMWLRTIINYQCRYGTTFVQALKTLLNEGGVARLYRGVTFALLQAPLARFVSTAANDGVDSFLASFSWTENWGPGRKTVVASIFVGLWRMILMRKCVCVCVLLCTGECAID